MAHSLKQKPLLRNAFHMENYLQYDKLNSGFFLQFAYWNKM